MTRETKVGLAMALLLVGVFGFLTYKRFTKPQETIAEHKQSADDENDDAPDADRLKLEEDDEFPTAARQREPEILTVAGNTRQIPQDETDEVDDPFGGGSNSASSTKMASSRSKMPTMVPDDDSEADLRGAFASDGEGDESATTRGDESDIEGNDPFLDGPGGGSSQMEIVSSPAAIEIEDDAEAESVERLPIVSSSAQPDRGPSIQSPGGNTRTSAFEEPETTSVKARAKRLEPVFDVEEEDSDLQVLESVSEPRILGGNSSAPQLMLDDSDDDRYGGYEPIELAEVRAESEFSSTAGRRGSSVDFFQPEAEPRRTAVTIAGDSHTVQPGENFWSISQKKYGTGRYFQALAAHNQSKIPDAAKMKPGVTIALPAADELERRYPNLIPKGGPSEPEAAEGQGNQPGEFLMGQDGRPLYRIGTRDTLSGISQKYLGRSSRWMQIFEMNRDVLKDGNSLKVGAVLRLPSDAGDLQLSNQPRAFR